MANSIELPAKPFNIRNDGMGAGHWGAPRGRRQHVGVDIQVERGQEITAPITGVVSKLGICYSDTPKYRYVRIEGPELVSTVMYVDPSVSVGDQVNCGDKIGLAQAVSDKYGEDMFDHVHWELWLKEQTVTLDRQGNAPEAPLPVNPVFLWGICNAGSGIEVHSAD